MEAPLSPLLIHLHKLPSSTPEESLAGVLETLWETRKSGLSLHQKSHIQSLLNLPVPRELDPPFSQQTRMTFPGRVNAPPAYEPLQVSNLSSWPREDNTRSCRYGVNNGRTIPSFSDSNLLHKSSVPALRDNGSSDNPATLPRLKSMTWSMELRNSIPGNLLSIITLKLQDYTKSHLGEVEVKFQLSRDTLEAMLRSITYINDQLSDSGRLQSEPSTKRPRQ